MKKLYEKLAIIEREYTEIYEVILECQEVAAKTINEDMVDMCWSLKSMSKYCDDLRKEMDRVREFLEKVVCLRWVQATLNQPVKDVSMTIYGKQASAVPTIKSMTSLPHKDRDTKAYLKFMNKIGVQSVAISEGLVRPHWPSVVKYITSLAEKGEPLPEGLESSRSYELYCLKMRKVKNNG